MFEVDVRAHVLCVEQTLLLETGTVPRWFYAYTRLKDLPIRRGPTPALPEATEASLLLINCCL